MTKSLDGIYSDDLMEAYKVASKNATDVLPDANIYQWYRNNLPDSMAGFHIIDWGAVNGRFLNLFLSKKASHISLVEPNESSLVHLKQLIETEKGVELLNFEMGEDVNRKSGPDETIHVSNFVLNCCPSIHLGLAALSRSSKQSERVIIFSNVFVPSSLFESANKGDLFSTHPFDIFGLPTQVARLPEEKTFKNVITSSGLVLTDAVHRIEEFRDALNTTGPWDVRSTALLQPCGFQHVISKGEDFGEYKFLVLMADLTRKNPK